LLLGIAGLLIWVGVKKNYSRQEIIN